MTGKRETQVFDCEHDGGTRKLMKFEGFPRKYKIT